MRASTCTDGNPEDHAGEPVDDGWQKPRWNPDDNLLHNPPPPDPHAFDDVVPRRLPRLPEEVTGDGVDPGAQPGQPQG